MMKAWMPNARPSATTTITTSSMIAPTVDLDFRRFFLPAEAGSAVPLRFERPPDFESAASPLPVLAVSLTPVDRRR